MHRCAISTKCRKFAPIGRRAAAASSPSRSGLRSGSRGTGSGYSISDLKKAWATRRKTRYGDRDRQRGQVPRGRDAPNHQAGSKTIRRDLHRQFHRLEGRARRVGEPAQGLSRNHLPLHPPEDDGRHDTGRLQNNLQLYGHKQHRDRRRQGTARFNAEVAVWHDGVHLQYWR